MRRFLLSRPFLLAVIAAMGIALCVQRRHAALLELEVEVMRGVMNSMNLDYTNRMESAIREREGR